MALWRCPVCGRQFANENQSHSHNNLPINVHFEGKKPEVFDLYTYLLSKISKFGPTKVSAVKSNIYVDNKSHFLAINVLADSLKLGFASAKVIKDKRIIRSMKYSANRYELTIKVAKKADIDKRLIGWLQDAYNLTG